MNSAKPTERFDFLMELGDYGQISSKQELISSISSGALLSLVHIRTQKDRFGYFEVLFENKKIGIVPPEVTALFFKDGVLQKNRCTVVGLVPKGQRTVTCRICVELFETEMITRNIEETSEFDNLSIDALPPKRVRTRQRPHGTPLVYIGNEKPIRRLFYKNELIILILCFLFPPVGVCLLIPFSRRKKIQKIAICSVSFCICFSVFFACYTVITNKPVAQVVTSNEPDRVALLFVENWQAENWENLLYLSEPGTTALLEDIEAMFGESKVGDFQFTEIYRSDSRVTYRLQIFIPKEDDNKKKKNTDEIEEITEFDEKFFNFDIVRIGTTWYVDMKSFNFEFFYEPLETQFASDTHVVIEPEDVPMVYLESDTLTYHNRKGCAPDGAPENKLSEALRKGYGPCYKCAR